MRLPPVVLVRIDMKLALAALFTTACLMPPQGGNTGSTQPSTASTPTESAPPPSSSPSRPTSTAPQTVSVTIRSACSKTAKVFYGNKPGFSSGTQSSISSNSVQSKTFKVGDQMWVTDDSGKGLDSVTIESSTRQIEIESSCSRLATR